MAEISGAPVNAPADPSRAARRASLAVFAVFLVNGFAFASWVSRLPAIRDALGLEPGEIGLVLLVGSAGSLVALPLTGAVVQRIGTRLTTRLATTLAALGLLSAAVSVQLGSVPALAIALFVATMGIGSWDVSMNLQGTVVEHALGRAIMPRFHAGFSLGAVGGAALGALAASLGLAVLPHIIAVVVFCVVTVTALTVLYLPDGVMTVRGEGAAAHHRRSALAAWTEPRTLLIGLMVLAAALTEGSANDWLALSVVDGFGSSNAVGALAFGLFVAAMTVMRFAGTHLLDRFGRVTILRSCAGLALVGLLVFWIAPSLPVAVVAIILWGFGAALGFPVGMSAASDDPVRSAARVSVVSSIGYIAFLVGPPVLGMLADHIGYRGALATIMLPLLLSLLLSPVAAPLKPDQVSEPAAV